MKITDLLMLLIFSFIILILMFCFMLPKYNLITFYDLSNLFGHGTNIGDKFPDFMVYDNKYRVSSVNEINKKNEYIVIIDGCDCKDYLVKKWCRISNEKNLPIIYVYINKMKFADNNIKGRNISIYQSNVCDISSVFGENEIKKFPIIYYINNENVIISKEE